MNIVLIGFASCGKSTTAKAICGRTNMRAVDLDRVVEERFERKHGRRMSCREIFMDCGAAGFSELENDALRSLSNMRDSVLSTGGRTPMSEENRAMLKSTGSVVYLRCGADTALSRMRDKGYPASMGGTEEGVRAAWGRRDPVYAGIADIVIDNDGLSPGDTAQMILEKLILSFQQTGGTVTCQTHSGNTCA